MAAGPLPDRARRLIAAHIVSVEQLEVLLLLRQARERTWTAEQVNDRIQSSVSSVTARLDDLVERGFLRWSSAGYQYDPPAEREESLAELAQAYAERRFTVIELIFSKPSDKLRAFADAFKVKPGEDEDG